jgi:hypothetical protein
MHARPAQPPMAVPLDPHCYNVTHSRVRPSTGRDGWRRGVPAAPQRVAYLAAAHAPQCPFNSMTA